MVVLPKPLSQLEGAVLPPDLDKNDLCICNLAMNCEGGGEMTQPWRQGQPQASGPACQQPLQKLEEANASLESSIW